MKYQSLNRKEVINFFNQNIVTFSIIIIFTFINGQVFIMTGNLIWLQIGAVSLCYLLFGYRVLIAVFLGIQFSSYWFHGLEFVIIPTGFVNLMGTLAPLLAIASMKFFKLSNLFEGGKLVFQHLLFLVILTAFYNTLMKFFAWSYLSLLNDKAQILKGMSDSIDAVQFIKNYLIGDILGCLTIFLFAALIIVPGIRYFAPNLVPSEFNKKNIEY